MQICVSTTTTSTGLQAYNDHHSSFNDVTAPQAFFAITATATVTLTEVPAVTAAIIKATLLKLDLSFLHPAKATVKNAAIKSESLLLHAQFGSAITAARIHAQNLLLTSVRDNSAIMMATHAGYSLRLIVGSSTMGAQQVAPAAIRNCSFKLIDALASEKLKVTMSTSLGSTAARARTILQAYLPNAGRRKRCSEESHEVDDKDKDKDKSEDSGDKDGGGGKQGNTAATAVAEGSASAGFNVRVSA